MPAVMGLSDTEMDEFNQVTYGKIKAMTDISKLKRLEKYMRDEGFPQTADMARQVIIERGGKVDLPKDNEYYYENLDADFDTFLSNIHTWQSSIKSTDQKLQGLRDINPHHDQNNEQLQNMSKEANPLIPLVRKSKNKSKQPRTSLSYQDESIKKQNKKDVRSGKDYYEQWDKYVRECEKEVEDQKTKEQDNTPNNSQIIESKHKKLLLFAKTRSAVEREWFGAREREKGNDLFKAKEYVASIDAYTFAIDLFSGFASSYSNRAAAYLKLNRWNEAHKDCCKALEIDPSYLKALMRRGVASLQLDCPKQALEDFESALLLDSCNSELIHLRDDAKKAIKKLQQNKVTSFDNNQDMPKPTPPIIKKKRLVIEEVEELPGNKSLFEEVIKSHSTTDVTTELNDIVVPQHASSINCTKKVVASNTICSPLITELPNESQQSKSEEACAKINELKTDNIKNVMDITNGDIVEFHNVSEGVGSLLADEWRIKGNNSFSIGDVKQAEECYAISLKHDSKNCATLLNQATCYLRLERYQEAEDVASKAIDIEPTSMRGYYRRGCIRKKLRKLEEAQQDFMKVLNVVPEDKQVQKELEAIVFEMETKKRTHVEVAEDMNNMHEEKVEAKLEENLYLPMRVGPMVFEEIESPQSTMPIAQDMRFNTSKRIWTSLQGEQSQGVNSLNEASTNRQLNLGAHGSMQDQIKIEKNKMIDDLEVKGDNAVSTNCFLKKCLRQGNTEEKACEQVIMKETTKCNIFEEDSDEKTASFSSSQPSHIQQHISLKDNAEEERLKGNDWFRKGHLTIALECYKKSIEYNPQVAAVFANKALCHLKMGEYEQATTSCDEALKLDPTFIKALYRRGLAQEKLENLCSALGDYEEVQKSQPQDKKLMKQIEKIKRTISLNKKERQFGEVDIPGTYIEDRDDTFMKVKSTTRYKTCETSSCGSCMKLDDTKNIEKTRYLVKENLSEKSVSLEALKLEESESLTETPRSISSQWEERPCTRNILDKDANKTTKTLPLPPTTALQFERGCTHLQDELELLQEYVSQVDSNKYPEIFKESLSADIMRLVARIICKAYMPHEPRGAIHILQGLTKVKRFKLTVMLLSYDDKKTFHNIFNWLRSAQHLDQEADLINLTKDYNM